MGIMYQIAVVFLWLMLYSFLGWLYESIYCSIREKRVINRGFLNGPLCPIYGFGALIILFFFQGQKNENMIVLFLSSAVLTCILEYITSWLLEKLFHVKLWDYSQMKFQINGRVCLLGAVVFGVFSVCLVKWIHPFFNGWILKIPHLWLYLISGLLFVLFLADIVVTVQAMIDLNQKLEEIQKAINLEKEKSRKRLDEFLESLHTRRADFSDLWKEKKADIQDVIRQAVAESKGKLRERFEKSEYNTDRIKKLLVTKHFSQRRLLRAFPKMKSVNANDALDRLREVLRKRKEK
jgi:uncharacterized membrane protein